MLSPIMPDRVRLVLLSRSPRRRQLLTEFGIDYAVEDVDVREEWPDGTPAAEVPVYLSRLKSLGYRADLNPDEILLSADTVVILDGRILGKPSSRDDAVEMLRSLSGREHDVVTGITLRSATQIMSRSCTTRVRFAPLTDAEIFHYVDTYSPMDKAGAYGVQEWIGMAGIVGIDGCYYNVMGLPMHTLYVALGDMIAKMYPNDII